LAIREFGRLTRLPEFNGGLNRSVQHHLI
jgi:hypothetical protein